MNKRKWRADSFPILKGGRLNSQSLITYTFLGLSQGIDRIFIIAGMGKGFGKGEG
jgi:hypothetical protein